MCGIVGYTGSNQAAPFLLKGLQTLEYRGYDSAGLEVLSPDGAKTVELPAGRWRDDLGAIHAGPAALRLENVPLSRLPRYERL